MAGFRTLSGALRRSSAKPDKKEPMDNAHSFENAESPAVPQLSAATHVYKIHRQAENTANLLILFRRSRAAMEVLHGRHLPRIRGDLIR